MERRWGPSLPGKLPKTSTFGSVEGGRLDPENASPSSFDALRPTVLGAIDGLITSFVIVIGAIAGGVNVRGALTIGFASLLADGFSMGASEFLSNQQETNDRWTSVRYGVACFLAFVVCGSVPLLTSFLVPETWDDASRTVIVSATYAVVLLIIGLFRGLLEGSVCRATLEVVGLGILVGAIAYGVASLTQDSSV
jgi:VIT1/CCC1 family predicted Fe2+/Mn2+ transporter